MTTEPIPYADTWTEPPKCGYQVSKTVGDGELTYACGRPSTVAYIEDDHVYIYLCARHDSGGALKAAELRGLVRVTVVPNA